ncbi:DUF397 domain-containing protein [Streptomyces buecherae]|uniref:DUF397 domain-containing protein n=1 Tax=Streptomyces buecherae TaxID=2763006 RepID=A0A7H8N981_9ACTN|nr:DUF397 domain-containing protein [Streptomyces buecherae]QKW51029.1 DUF397 domain-containing protein [Streptomyces buecherae]
MSITPETDAGATWVKSSYSNGDGGNCVEWAPSAATHGTVPVRDSKNPDGPTLTFDTQAWAAFVNAVQRGEFA